MLTIEDIYEDDYGCEEMPQGAEPMVLVIAREAGGACRTIRMADRLALARNLQKGDAIVVLPDGTAAHGDGGQSETMV